MSRRCTLKFRCVIDITMLLTWRRCFLRSFGRCSAHLHIPGDFLLKVLNPLLMILYDWINLLLQPLTMSKLLVYKCLHFATISNTARFCFAFILLPNF